ncbi:MAG: AI-2E family transporter [Candidatus Rokubacteria bacterium]|nr:AI-2E family transporter [Candidatus Rokubacteria bacterium]
MSQEWARVLRPLLAAVGLGLGLWFLYLILDILLLLYVAGLFAVALAPAVAALDGRRLPGLRARLPRWAAVLLCYLGLAVLALVLVSLVLPPLVSQAQAFYRDFPGHLDRLQRWVEHAPWSEFAPDLPGLWVEGSRRLGELAVPLLRFVFGFLGGVVWVVTILFVAFYLLVDYDRIRDGVLRLFPGGGERARQAFGKMTRKVSRWVAGQLLLGLIMGVAVGIALTLFGIRYAYVLALVAAIGELIPVIGPILAAIPALLVALAVSPTTALLVLAFYVLIQQIEGNFLAPKLLQQTVGLHPITVIVALLIGAKLLGLLGALLAVPTAGIVQVLLEEIRPPRSGEGGAA